MPLSRLAERIGSTPFFAYDRKLLDSRVELLRKSLPSTVKLSYAMKANPMPAVVQHLAGLVDAMDVASAQEMAVALDTLLRPEQISFAGPGKTVAEIRRAVAAGVTVEPSPPSRRGGWSRLAMLWHCGPGRLSGSTRTSRSKAPACGWAEARSSSAWIANKYQFYLPTWRQLTWTLSGFHVFAGSQNLQAEILCEAQRRTVDLVLQLAQHCRQPVRYVNLGGGFGIPYFEKDEPLDLAAVGDNLAALVDGPLARELPEAQPVIELGRYIVGECGVYVTKIMDRKVSAVKPISSWMVVFIISWRHPATLAR